jgi:hypothetical protein
MLAACGGGDGGGGVGAAPAPVSALPSAGGVWAAPLGDGPGTLYIAENGQLQYTGSCFGAGSVTVSADGEVSGTVREVATGAVFVGAVSAEFSPPVPPIIGGRFPERSCAVTGTVNPRVALEATFTCTSSSGSTTTRRHGFVYTAQLYETPSSLVSLGGNYTMAFGPAGNMLNVNSDGEVFGMYDNGWRCTVNGRFSPIDARFSLLRAEWTFSSCIGTVSQGFEGTTFSGFVQRFDETLSSSTIAPGSLYLLLTGTVQGRLTQVSVIYRRT